MQIYDVAKQLVSIYGLFDDAGLCLYVGQAFSPAQRCARHRKTKQFSSDRVLRTCLSIHAGRIEQQVISAYKKRGQCSLNRATAVVCYNHHSRRNGFIVWVPELDLYFESKGQAARFLGYTEASHMSHAQKRGECHCIDISDPFRIYQYDPESKYGKDFARRLAKNQAELARKDL